MGGHEDPYRLTMQKAKAAAKKAFMNEEEKAARGMGPGHGEVVAEIAKTRGLLEKAKT